MKTLFIDSHLNDIVIILYNNGNIVQKEVITEKTQNSKYLMPAIASVIADNKIDEIIVVNGPGSFTGARLGVTIAKTFAYCKHIPIKAITYLEMMALSIENTERKVAFNDRNGYFYAEFDANMNLVGDYVYYSNKDFTNFSKDNDIITNVTIDYEKVFEYLKAKSSFNPHLVNPIYVKKIEVEYDKKS